MSETPQLETWPTDSLVPADTNAKRHPPEQLQAIAESMRAFGFVQPILVDRDSREIIAGHARHQVALQLGMPEVPVVPLVHLDEAQRRAYCIADNRLAELGSWDEAALARELAAIAEAGDVTLDAVGFSDEELQEMLAGLEPDQVAEGHADAVPTEVKAFVRAGDLWQLGEHRLLCGDATSSADVELLLDGERMDLCMTDPPYGADVKYATAMTTRRDEHRRAIAQEEKHRSASHDDTQAALVALIAGFFPLARAHCDLVALTPGIANLWLYERPDWVLCWFYAAGTGCSHWGFTAWQPFMVWGKCPKRAAGEGRHPDGFHFQQSGSDRIEQKTLAHACPKPASVWARFMDRFSSAATKTVFDPFVGSGTTLVVCEQSRRRCFALEIDPLYASVAVRRWEAFTGRKARRLRR